LSLRGQHSGILKTDLPNLPRDTSVDLPDFCQPRAVFLLVLLGLLLALLLALAGQADFYGFWNALGLHALMVESVVLAACLLLCASRNLLMRMPASLVFAIIFVVIQLLTVGFSLFSVRFLVAPGALDAGFDAGPWLLRNLLISLIASLVFVRYLILYRQWQVQVRAEADARLDALQAHIRPHFLFNTLNTIASLVRTRPGEAEQAVLDLADLLRTGLRRNAEHTVAEELELVRGYLRIESQRLGDRLRIEWQVADSLPLEQNVPALLLQPLVENAIVHGIAGLPEGGRLRIVARAVDGGRWCLRVENPWPGDREMPAASGTTRGNQMALDNIRQRLELAYGDRASLKIDRTADLFSAEIRIPADAKKGSASPPA